MFLCPLVADANQMGLNSTLIGLDHVAQTTTLQRSYLPSPIAVFFFHWVQHNTSA